MNSIKLWFPGVSKHFKKKEWFNKFVKGYNENLQSENERLYEFFVLILALMFGGSLVFLVKVKIFKNFF